MLAAELNKNKVIVHPTSGVILLRLCFQILFFFRQSGEVGKRQAVLDVLEEYTRVTGDVYRWTQNPQSGAWKRLIQGWKEYVQPKDWLMDISSKESWEFIYHAGEKAADASDIEIDAYGEDFWGNRDPTMASYLLCQFPLDFFGTPDDFASLARDWSARLRPEHGYGGFCLARSHGDEHGMASSYEYQLAQRFPGVDVRWPLSLCEDLGDAIKGADWLTIVSEHYVDILGGRKAVRQAMGDMPMLEYDDGVVLQAGPLPQLGDTEHGIDLPDYRRVAAIVEPVRMKHLKGIHIGSAPHPRFSREEYTQWLARFNPRAE